MGPSNSCSPAGSSARCRAATRTWERAKRLVDRDHLRRPRAAPKSATRWRASSPVWEGLARTERQDRVAPRLREARQRPARRLLLLPLWLFGQLIGGRVRDLLMALERRGRRPLPVPPERERERTMDGLMRGPAGVPADLRHSDFAELRRGFADISNFVVAQQREGAVLGYRYPGQFQDHIVEGADGERIAASIALQEAARPIAHRRPRALHLEPLRLRPPNRGPRLLRVGLQRRGP